MADDNNNSFVLYTSYFEILEDLSDEQMGKLFRAILEYKTTKKQPVVSVDLLVVFKFIKNQLDIDEEKYNKKIQKQRNNGRKGGAPKGNQNAKKQPKTTQNKHNDNDNDNDNELFSNKLENNIIELSEQKKFKKPTLKEIEDYCLERKNNIDPQYFFDYYESCNWMRGKTRMKDWRATIRTWERVRNKNNSTPKKEVDGWSL